MFTFFLTGVGFAMAFKFIQPLDVLALFTGFILVLKNLNITKNAKVGVNCHHF